MKIISFQGLLVNYCSENGISTLVRGVRSEDDVNYELQMAHMNKELNSDIETIFLPTNKKYSFVSSSLIKEVLSFGADVTNFVPVEVSKRIRKKDEIVKRFRGNNMKIDLEIMDLFQELEELIEHAPVKGLARKSISIEKEEILSIINDIKSLLPEEVNQAIWINRERQRIITEAKIEADQIIAQANQEAELKVIEGEKFEENLKQQFDDIVESNEVVVRAKERATEIISKAEAYAVEIREGSLEYAEDVISSVEQNLIETLEIVKSNKRELREG